MSSVGSIGPDPEHTLIPPHVVAAEATWVDIGLAVTGCPLPSDLYADLLAETEDLLERGMADLCFFIHKPPGLRWRLRATAGTPVAELRRAATEAASRVTAPDQVRGLLYEPQQALFGGPLSMEFVHRTWFADSMLWMRWHAESVRPSLSARWEVSFGVLAHLFRRLGVVGWEDREVWDCVVQDTGRQLAEHEWERPEVVALAKSLRERWGQAWGSPNTAPALPSGAGADQLHAFSVQTGPVLADWLTHCLSRPTDRYPLTPRKAAAYWTVFHWNRAGLPAAQQALTTQTLAGRVAVVTPAA